LITGTTIEHVRYGTFTKYIGRPSIFGNPYTIGPDGTREEVIDKFKKYFYNKIETDKHFKNQVLELKGHRLGCYCYPKACHGDVIIEWLENERPHEIKSSSIKQGLGTN